MWNGQVYNTNDTRMEGFFGGLISAAADGVVKGMGFGEIPGQTVDAAVPPQDKKDKVNEGIEPFSAGDIDSRGDSSGDPEEDQDNDAPEDSPYWGRRAAGCLFYAKNTGNVLFGLRSDRVMEPHTWAGFGGKLDGDETPIEGLERELSEEIGYDGMDQYVGVCVFKDPEHDFQYYNFLVICDDEFEPWLNDETDDYQWTDVNNPPQPIHPNLAQCMSYYKSAVAKLKGR